MSRLRETLDALPRERLAELVSAGCYGTVLVLAALGVVGVSDVALGHGSELVAGVGLATWLAHIFAELVGGHARRPEPLRRGDVVRSLGMAARSLWRPCFRRSSSDSDAWIW
jgi:hypothetical protein